MRLIAEKEKNKILQILIASMLGKDHKQQQQQQRQQQQQQVKAKWITFPSVQIMIGS